ncbi:MAG: serine/threonine-protein kinase [Gemmatimonadaceae bacterium]
MACPTKRGMEEPGLLDKLRQALAPQYDVERVLGHGGMGMVVRGRDRALDRPVAIKVISPNLDVAPRHRQRFLQEARIVAKLRHPNIVAVYSAGESDGLLYFVMEYVPGESLRDLLTRDRCCDTGRAEAILRDLADALAYAHEQGVVHRDIKPENVLLDHDSGRAMLADFGVAQALTANGGERLTGPGVVVGSPAYMSPEQAAGDRALDGRSDIYALGLIGYEMLAGEPAFSGPSVVSVLAKQLTEPPPPLAPRAPGTSPAVIAAITRALEKQAEDRWQDASEFARALAGDSPAAPPAPAPEPVGAVPMPEPVAPTAPAHPAPRPLPERPRPSPFVGPGRPPPRAGRARRLASWLTGVSAALLLAAPLAWFAWPRGGVSSGAADLRPSLLVMPFDLQSADSALAPLREQSAPTLALSLAESGAVDVTRPQQTADLMRGAGLDTVPMIALVDAFELARRAGARLVVVGQISGRRDSVAVVASTYDVRTGTLVRQTQHTAAAGTEPRVLFDPVARAILDATRAAPAAPAVSNAPQ